MDTCLCPLFHDRMNGNVITYYSFSLLVSHVLTVRQGYIAVEHQADPQESRMPCDQIEIPPVDDSGGNVGEDN